MIRITACDYGSNRSVVIAGLTDLFTKLQLTNRQNTDFWYTENVKFYYEELKKAGRCDGGSVAKQMECDAGNDIEKFYEFVDACNNMSIPVHDVLTVAAGVLHLGGIKFGGACMTHVHTRRLVHSHIN